MNELYYDLIMAAENLRRARKAQSMDAHMDMASIYASTDDSPQITRSNSREDRSLQLRSLQNHERVENSPREPLKVISALRCSLESKRQMAEELREKVILASSRLEPEIGQSTWVKVL